MYDLKLIHNEECTVNLLITTDLFITMLIRNHCAIFHLVCTNYTCYWGYRAVG